MIAYPATLDVPRELLGYVGRLLYRERRRRGTPKNSRRLTCFHQALFALAWFRSKPNIRLHGIAFGLSQATAYRYLHEAIDVLSTQAPDLHQALDRAVAAGVPHLILDGKIFNTDRCRIKTTSVKGETIDAWFSGKTSDFGENVRALCEPDGFPIRTSHVEPGGAADIEAARRHVLPAVHRYATTMPVIAGPGYQGAGARTLRTPPDQLNSMRKRQCSRGIARVACFATGRKDGDPLMRTSLETMCCSGHTHSGALSIL
ncbi:MULTISPECIES: transposase family protein [Microbispora]|uniref:Transposase family protein n=1 Tax=Microbispora hainanensis TaxID=568844 RepID=A0ABZ1SM75_9ACTN|nr:MULTISPECIES: transposase family protein [Microbispora]